MTIFDGKVEIEVSIVLNCKGFGFCFIDENVTEVNFTFF